MRSYLFCVVLSAAPGSHRLVGAAGEVKQEPRFPKQAPVGGAYGKRESEEETGVGARAKSRLARVNEEGEEQPSSNQIVFERQAEVCGW